MTMGDIGLNTSVVVPVVKETPPPTIPVLDSVVQAQRTAVAAVADTYLPASTPDVVNDATKHVLHGIVAFVVGVVAKMLIIHVCKALHLSVDDLNTWIATNVGDVTAQQLAVGAVAAVWFWVCKSRPKQ